MKAFLAVLACIIVVGSIILFHLNYKCVSHHYEWRTDCHVHRDAQGRRTSESCYDRRVEVCDEWEER